MLTQLAAATENLRINDQVFTGNGITLLLEMLQRDTPSLTAENLIDSIVENHLLAEYVNANALGDTHDNSVGFDPAVRIENQVISTFRTLFKQQINDALYSLSKGQGPTAFILTDADADRSDPLSWLDPAPLIYALNQEQVNRAENILVARYALPNQSPRDITLAEIYRRQNVQGRIALHQQDHEWLDNEIRLLIAQQYVRWWCGNKSGLDIADLSTLEQFVHDRFIAQAYIAQTGVSAEMHHDNPALRQRAAEVSTTQIQSWYHKNLKRFTEISSIDAWHIRCVERLQCEHAYSELQQGMTFFEAIKKYSSDDDVNQDEPGYLSKLTRGKEKLPWLHAVALMQPAGNFSKPIHAPGSQTQHWEILYTDHPDWFTHAADSRTVEVVARREIAKQLMISEFATLQSRLEASARISRPEA